MEYKEKKTKQENLQIVMQKVMQIVHIQPFLFSRKYGTTQYLLLTETAGTRTVCVRCFLCAELRSDINVVVSLDYSIFSFSINYQFCLIITFMSDVLFG